MSTYPIRRTTPLRIPNVENELRCVNCGDPNGLHHSEINIFERKEDAATGLHVCVSGLKAHIGNDIAGNPSDRRDGITIKFWCELCGWESLLSIAQHKGQELVCFRPLGKRPYGERGQ